MPSTVTRTLAIGPGAERKFPDAEFGERGPGAGPPGGELRNALRDSPRDALRFRRVQFGGVAGNAAVSDGDGLRKQSAERPFRHERFNGNCEL